MSRGGVRRGRRNDPAIVQELHCRIERRSHAVLTALANQHGIGLGQVVDKVVRLYVRSKQVPSDRSQPNHNDSSNDLQEAA